MIVTYIIDNKANGIPAMLITLQLSNITAVGHDYDLYMYLEHQ